MPPGDTARFVSRFVRNPSRVGALAPSSPRLARAMLEDLSLGPGEAVVEFGPGTGAFTRLIARRLPDPAHYLGIEQDPRFVELLRKRFPGMRVVEGSAEHALHHVDQAGLTRVRAVICGLPFASLPKKVQDGVIQAVDALVEPGSEFRTFQYVHAFGLPRAQRYRQRMRDAFGPHERSRPVIRNTPPAYVLTWRR